MCDERRSVYLTLFDEAEHFLTVAAIYATALGTLPCLMCRSLEQMLLSVTLTIASVGIRIVGLGLSVMANLPCSMYVNAFMYFDFDFFCNESV